MNLASPEVVQKKLFEYGLWYTSRYTVSLRKFKQKLEKRLTALLKVSTYNDTETPFDLPKILEGVLMDISPYYDEVTSARSVLELAVHLGKPPKKVLRSLSQSLYSQDTILCMEDEFSEYFCNFDSMSQKILQKIQLLADRGYGELYILPCILRDFGCSKDEVGRLFSNIDFEESLREYVSKKVHTDLSSSSYFQHLYRRGYSSDCIKKVLKYQDNSD